MSQGIYIDPTSKRPEPAGEAFRVIPAENGWVIRYGGSYYNMSEEKIAVATSAADLLRSIAEILEIGKHVTIAGYKSAADEAPF
jgi:hypothetical protein